jgi:hypothetical protein
MELYSAGRPNVFGVFPPNKRVPGKLECKIGEADIGKWLTMVMDLDRFTTAVVFAKRGKMNE